MRGIVAGDRKLETSDVHPDWTTAYGQFGNYKLVAASAVGHLHLYKRTPRDDAFALRSEGNWLAVAVADGVGSKPRSRFGATCAVDALCRYLLCAVQAIATEPQPDFRQSQLDFTPNASDRASGVVLDQPDDGADAGHNTVSAYDDPEPSGVITEEGQVVGHPTPSLDRTEPDEDKGPAEKNAAEIEHVMNDANASDQDSAGSSVPAENPEQPMYEMEENKYITDETTIAQPVLTSQYTLRSETEEDMAFGTLSWNRIAPLIDDFTSGSGGYVSEGTMIDALRQTHKDVIDYAAARGATEPREFACTLMGLLLNTQTGDLVVGHIGDGLVAGQSAEQMLRLVEPVAPPGGQGTYVFTDPRWETHGAYRSFTTGDATPFQTLFLMTDGVADDVQAPDDIFQPWGTTMAETMRDDSAPLSQKSVGLLQYLMRKKKSGNADDRTLVIIWHV